MVDKHKDEEEKVERRTGISEKETGGKGKVENSGKGQEVEVANDVDVTKGACLKTSTSLIKVTGSRLYHAEHLELLKQLEK